MFSVHTSSKMFSTISGLYSIRIHQKKNTVFMFPLGYIRHRHKMRFSQETHLVLQYLGPLFLFTYN